MFFDDRLATVLRQTGESEAGARTQFRQLLDILGNRKFGAGDKTSQSLVAAAWLRMDALSEIVPAGDRAAAIRERGWRFRNANLAAHLADFEPEVASAALRRADLSEGDWSALIPRLPVRARGFLRLRDDLPLDAEALLDRLGVHDRGLPQPEPQPPSEVGSDAVKKSSEAPPISVAGIGTPPTILPPNKRPADFELTAANEPFELDQEVPKDELPGDDAALNGPSDESHGSSNSEISALVERIAQFRREREVAQNLDNSPLLPLEDDDSPTKRELDSFGFTVDSSGKIDWAESKAGAMVIGKRIVPAQAFADPAKQSLVERAFERRQPIPNAPISLNGADAIAGDWIIDAQPRFTDEGGFSGYVGRFRRPAHSDREAESRQIEADRIRQLLHELRTPVTAVQGYAEVIQQQLFGPAPHEYRALAAAIAADAARILAGFEELDRLARLETGAIEIEEGEADLAAITKRTAGQLAGVLSPRMAGVEYANEENAPVPVALDAFDADALIWRLLATLGGACSAGEIISCRLERGLTRARLICELPAQLSSADDIFAADLKPANSALTAGLFGAGFSLRLARAEARAASGSLLLDGDNIVLTLPLLTSDAALPSQMAEGDGVSFADPDDSEHAEHRANGEA